MKGEIKENYIILDYDVATWQGYWVIQTTVFKPAPYAPVIHYETFRGKFSNRESFIAFADNAKDIIEGLEDRGKECWGGNLNGDMFYIKTNDDRYKYSISRKNPVKIPNNYLGWLDGFFLSLDDFKRFEQEVLKKWVSN